jgi:hypothetical protein
MSLPASTPGQVDRVHASLRSDYVQPTLGHALRVWWAFYWRTLGASFVLTALASALLRLMAQTALISVSSAAWAVKAAPYVFFYSMAIPVTRFVLHKRFRRFRVAVWPLGGQPTSEVDKPTYSQAIRVWWSFTWRATIYGALATTLAGFPLRFVAGLFAPSPQISALLEMWIALIVQAAVALFVLYSNILDEDMSDFHVGLVANDQEPRLAGEIAASTVS